MQHRTLLRWVALGLFSSVPFAACGANDSELGPGAGGGAAAAGSGGGAAASGDGGDGDASLTGDGEGSGGSGGLFSQDALGTGGGSGDQDGALNADSACAAERKDAEVTPLDMYVMLDQSLSMEEREGDGGPTRWQKVSDALNAFVQDSGAAGVGVGIGYFGTRHACTPPSSCPWSDGKNYRCLSTNWCNAPGSCNAADYETPDVAIEPLPGVASKITASLAGHGPTTGTPTSAALQGAINHAKTWAGSHANHTVIVVLATDGEPSVCDTNIDNIAAIAKAGFDGTPRIRTFVIGVGALDSLNKIAQEGGTTQAFVIKPGQDTTKEFIDAMNNIRRTALPCEYTLPAPDGGTLDPSKVNVDYTPGNVGGGDAGAPQRILQVDDDTKCDATGGWYYDNPSAPTKVIMCPASCTSLKAGLGGRVDVLLGCKSERKGPA